MEVNDNRTAEQESRMKWLVVGTDTFLSGWGKARNGNSYAAWACEAEHVDHVLRCVSSREDMARVRVVAADGYRPGPACAHLSIYAVDPGHAYHPESL